MAEKRMFTQKIIDSDAFLEMPLSTQSLYFHLNMRADDDGFINNPKKIQRMIAASEDDLKLLIAKRFVLCFESGVIVIKHWRMHNTLQKDRYKPTQYQDEYSSLAIKDNRSYTEKDNQLEMGVLPLGNSLETECKQDGNRMDTQYSIDKYSVDQYRVVESSGNVSNNGNNKNVENVENSTLEFMGGTLGKGVVLLTDAQRDALLEKIGFDAFNHYVEKLANFIIEKKAKVGNHYMTILKWAKEDMKV